MNHSECKAQEADKRSDLVIMLLGAIEIHGNTEFTQKPVDNWARKCGLNQCVVRVIIRWHHLTDTARNIVFVIARGQIRGM